MSVANMQAIKIREAVREDCEEITGLIQELADSSGRSENVRLKSEMLEEDGFNSEHTFFKCYVAEAEGKLVGYALYYYTYSTWTGKSMFLEDLYVTPEFRKKHIGSLLFKTVAKKAADSKCSRLDFMVLNWNPAKDFYKSKGAIDLTEKDGWHHYRLDDMALKDLATTV